MTLLLAVLRLLVAILGFLPELPDSAKRWWA